MAQEEWDIARVHHITQNGVQYKTYELFISGLSHLIVLKQWFTAGNQNCGKQNC